MSGDLKTPSKSAQKLSASGAPNAARRHWHGEDEGWHQMDQEELVESEVHSIFTDVAGKMIQRHNRGECGGGERHDPYCEALSRMCHRIGDEMGYWQGAA